MSISNSPPFGGVGGGYKKNIMAQEDDLRALGKVMDFMRGISVIFLLVNCYWFCYEAFHIWGFTLGIIDKILINFQRTTG